MTSNDKAKQQLMESMRMTKAGADNIIETADSTQKTVAQDEKPVSATRTAAVTKKVAVKKKVAAPKKAVVKKKATVTKKATATNKSPTKSQKSAVDPFQSVRRVWPD